MVSFYGLGTWSGRGVREVTGVKLRHWNQFFLHKNRTFDLENIIFLPPRVITSNNEACNEARD